MLLFCLLVYSGVVIQAYRPQKHTEYDTFRSLIPRDAPLDKNKHIALLLYNPQGCMPCNYILTNLFANPAYAALFGDNSFVVFPSVRPSELQDYDRLFKTYGKVSVRLINDQKLYNLLLQKDREILKGKPKWFGLNTRSRECFCFNLREVYIADSIACYFNN
ncbi:MAG TPA: hypothetical protein VL092_08345 [Chitinophagaceae bacterium]|nr:hypothetical protein [Chitinophagaceae bacterium]